MKAPAKKSKVVSKSAGKSASKAKATSAAKPAAKPAVKKAAAKPTAKPTPKPAAKGMAAAKPAEKPAAKKPVAKKAVPSKQAAKSPAKPVVKPKSKAAVKPPTKSLPQASLKASPKPAVKVPAKKAAKPVAKAPTKAPAKAPASAPAKAPVKTPIKASTKPPTPPVSKAQPKPAAAPVPAKPVAPPPAPVKTKAGSRVVPSYAPSPSDMSPHGGNTAAKASFTMSAPVLAPPPQVVIKKDAKLVNNWKTKTAEQLTDNEVIAMPDSEYMNAKQLAFFRLKLVALKNGILSNAGETTEHLREDTSVVPDPADRATIEEEHALELRTRDRERKLLKKIEQSIASIDAEEYGYCDETGEPIGVARLIARPTATLSLEAQQRRELKQKMFGD
ncbi:RNA polymerase-binding protein DksA [Variovorax sp. PCZ-1]|uniref:RNA polymerase-binding protein DksA n=1 Tax=Variovorax sp. PCZ-1 TaxID=2835533 RepID=UPI0020C06271|nr:RNA polymerase-binding protein DksA [Variovorax sp. PCZ-1]